MLDTTLEPALQLAARGVPSAASGRDILADLVAYAIDEIDYGLLLVKPCGIVLLANRAARQACADAAPLRIAGARLSAASVTDRDALARALREAARGRRTLLRLGSPQAPASAAALPLRAAPPATHDAPTDGVVLLLLGRQALCGTLSVEFFAHAHGLTATEVRVLRALCQGERPSTIARRCGVALSTVRTHVSSIRSKTDAPSIRELVRLVAMLPPIVPAVPACNLH
jgi:DNA-binding NarL/FixJ family response regulator